MHIILIFVSLVLFSSSNYVKRIETVRKRITVPDFGYFHVFTLRYQEFRAQDSSFS